MADVLYELLTNRDAVTGEFIGETVRVKAKAATQLVLTAPMGVLDGTDPDGGVEIIGVGPVPRQILGILTPDTELASMIFDRAGRPLWLGRNQRLGNAAQRLAVAIRDGGCFECGAPMHQCELHHMEEWHRDRGQTNVNNLIAVCRQHHKWLETQDLVVRRTPTGYQTHPRAGPDPPNGASTTTLHRAVRTHQVAPRDRAVMLISNICSLLRRWRPTLQLCAWFTRTFSKPFDAPPLTILTMW